MFRAKQKVLEMGKITDVVNSALMIILGLVFLKVSEMSFNNVGFGYLRYIGVAGTLLIGLYFIASTGYAFGVGKPKDEMLPENKEFKVKKIIDNDTVGGSVEIILCPSFGKNAYYLLKTKHFVHSPKQLKEDDIIKNIYGKYQVFSKPSS